MSTDMNPKVSGLRCPISCRGSYNCLGRLQHTSDNPITLDQDARTPINDSIRQVLLNIVNNGLILGSRLQPEGRDREVFGLLQEAQRDLYPNH